MEPTEMAGVAEAETQYAHAWALDYDDPDEFPTEPVSRLTPRRITALGLATSLIVIAVAGVVALTVARQPGQQEAAPRPAPPLALPTITVTAPFPPPPVAAPPSPPVVVPAPAPTRKQSTPAERNFVSAVFANIPTWVIPGGRPSDDELVAHGYRACEVMDQHPDNRRRAAYVFYEELGLNMGVMVAQGSQEMWEFMGYADTYLCNAS